VQVWQFDFWEAITGAALPVLADCTAAAAAAAGSAPLLAMLRALLAGQSAIDHEVPLALSQNYCSDDLTWALDWSSARQLAGRSFAAHSFVHAALIITLEKFLPDIQLLYNINTNVTGISNYTRLLDYYESVILRYLSDASYTWDNTWAFGEFPGEADSMLALHARVFVHLYRQYGNSDYAFVPHFAKAVLQLSNR
jgi:hypothetical protein